MSLVGHEQTNRPRLCRVCLYSVNRPQSRRKQTLCPVFPGQDLPRPLALAPGSPARRGFVPETALERTHPPRGAGESLIAHAKSGPSELCDGDASCLPERARLQPRYRGLAHTIGPREIGLRSAFRESLDGFLALMWGQDRRTPKTHPAGLGALPTVTCAGKD